jgi:hypothetical protein
MILTAYTGESMKKFKPKYSGCYSSDFWIELGRLPQFPYTEAHFLARLLQDMEEQVLERINAFFGNIIEEVGPPKTWTDPKTSLKWSMKAEEMSWDEAHSYAKSLGQGWGVPTIEELESLLDRSLSGPAVRQEVPFRDSSSYWSSSTDAGLMSLSWYVNFYCGSVGSYYRTDSYCFRCVRGEIK